MCIDGCDPEEFEGRMWSEAAPGSTASVPCLCNDAEGLIPGRVTRQCVGTYGNGAEWGDTDNNQCTDNSFAVLCMLAKVSCTL